MIKSNTILFLLIALVLISILVYLSQNLYRAYKKEAKQALKMDSKTVSSILTEKDTSHLPTPVQKYFIYTGSIGKEKVHNFHIAADGEIQLNKKWSKVDIKQSNFTGNNPIRLFYFNVKGYFLPLYALHSYTDKQASMLVKLGGLIPVVDVKGKEMRVGDTVTLLNDMCIFAPASLIDPRIQWEPIDSLSAKAHFKTRYCTVSATLYFNHSGELINFVSEDRYYHRKDGSFVKARWSTPMKDYKNLNGYMLASYIEAVWNFSQGDDCYFKVSNIKELKYNYKILN